MESLMPSLAFLANVIGRHAVVYHKLGGWAALDPTARKKYIKEEECFEHSISSLEAA